MKNYNIKEVAEKYIGQTEIKGNMGFTNPDFEKRMKAVGFKPSYQWCAIFAELVWNEAYQGDKEMLKVISKNCNPSAVKTFKNFNAEGMTSYKPVVGSMVIWQSWRNGHRHWTGHAGIVVEVNDENFVSIEGNTNDSGGREGYVVARKKRSYRTKVHNGIAVLGFINPPNTVSNPFKNKIEGNKFRKWVNDNHPEYAREIDLDRTGSHTNSYIMKAWAKFKSKYEA